MANRDKDDGKEQEREGEAPGEEDQIGQIFPELPQRVQSLMEERELTWGDLVERTGLSRPTLYRMARGEGNPALKSFIALAKHLGTSAMHLLGPQSGVEHDDSRRAVTCEPLLAEPPPGDPRAKAIYQAVCKCTPLPSVNELIRRTHFAEPGESSEDTISRAILDVFHRGQAWIDHHQLPRAKALEQKIYEKFDLPTRQELQDNMPVRVIDLPRKLLPMVQIHALAVVTAALVREFLRKYRILGFADGFTASRVLKFLQRGDLSKAELVPLTHTPRFVQFELSCEALIGSLALAHQGYEIRSTIELADLQERIREVQVAVTACGSVKDKGPLSRLARLMREASPEQDYGDFLAMLESRGVVGDLLYHFLRGDGKWMKNIFGSAHDIELVSLRKLQTAAKGDPSIYSVSPTGMARIAKRGVCLLIVHSEGRAALARAALQRKERPVNFLVITRAAAEELLEDWRRATPEDSGD